MRRWVPVLDTRNEARLKEVLAGFFGQSPDANATGHVPNTTHPLIRIVRRG